MSKKRSKNAGYSGVLASRAVREFLMEAAGERALQVVSEMTEPMSDDDLASVCKTKVSEVRSVLNKLHNYGLADYIRTRDKDSGWYSYTWYTRLDKVKEAVTNKWQEEVNSIEKRLCEESTELFECKRCKKKPKMAFELASEVMFRCNACNAKLKLVNNQKTVKELTEKRDRLARNPPLPEE
ncbi:hypothetical protein HY992_06200 [Candidatus Micrarchaeota archaeon]|nr:hypothetical protein [Candidatus Micrarchaeota archaeon]